jgi:hypothetical protein
MPCCPFCSSEMVYPLLNTLRCKRCKNIWKVGEEGAGRFSACCSAVPGKPLSVRKKTDPLETRLERKLDAYLSRSGGKFCFAATTWQAGDISEELFRKYLNRCVKSRALAEKKDSYGRIWYFRLC